jgi:DNA-binding NtrC family response regulator
MDSQRILVIDDEAPVLSALARALTLAGYEVEVAQDPRQGVARVAALRPAVVLTDATMPQLDGFEVARQVLALGFTTQVVLMTGFIEPIRVLDAYQAGVSDYLPKARLREELLDVVARACLRYERWRTMVNQAFFERAPAPAHASTRTDEGSAR